MIINNTEKTIKPILIAYSRITITDTTGLRLNKFAHKASLKKPPVVSVAKISKGEIHKPIATKINHPPIGNMSSYSST
ncbi:hypothetical protein D3C79_1057050 [compost metagenome]